MAWEPNERETEYVSLIQSMCLDAHLGRGVANRQTFTVNLRMMAEQIDALERDRVMNPPGRATEQAQ